VRPESAGLIARAHSVTSCDMQSRPQRPSEPRLRIRIVFGEDEMIGPGKADLLEGVARHGSIAAAGREMGMSYRRAWELIGRLNTMFRAPLVESQRGGPGGGGAVLTVLGREVLAHYRAVEADAAAGGAAHLAALHGLLGDIPDEK
jgi:molybdate transport system regulatory protein